MKFSQRKGLTAAGKALQLNQVDPELRNGLWSALHDTYFSDFGGERFIEDSPVAALFRDYWLSYFKLPTDSIPALTEYAVGAVRKYFFECKWYQVYDFLEFSIQHGPSYAGEALAQYANVILERENSGYRVVGSEIVAITNQSEIAAIEDAQVSPFVAVNLHISKALSLLADRKSPDYSNSIKESISAVESAAKLITNQPKVTLKPALDVLDAKRPLHPALRKAFENLYGYTSDAQGIRHALLDAPNLTFDDAKFMLVACSAFVNYLVGTTAR